MYAPCLLCGQSSRAKCNLSMHYRMIMLTVINCLNQTLMTTRGILAKSLNFLLPYLMELFSYTGNCLFYSFFSMIMCHASSIVSDLSVSISHYIPWRDVTSDWLEPFLSACSYPPFTPYATGISSWLVYTFWKFSWHSSNIAKQTLHVYCHVNIFFWGVSVFCGLPYFVSSPPPHPSKLINTNP